MMLGDPGWLGVSVRALRAVRDCGWWVRQSAHDAMCEVVAEEARRISLQAASLPVAGTLRRSLERGHEAVR